MKVSLQHLLAFRASTDQVARSRLSGVVNGPQPVRPASVREASEAGPALTLLATSNKFIAESFFLTAGPLASEYHNRAPNLGGLDLRVIDVPKHLLGALVQKLLQGGEAGDADVVRRLLAMPAISDEAFKASEGASKHIAGHVTFYNSDHDHTNVYAVLFKPDRHEVEVALYRNAPEVAAASQRSETLPAVPFFRQRIDITPLLEASAQHTVGAFTYHGRLQGDEPVAPDQIPLRQHDWSKRVAVVGGLACLLTVIWYAMGS